MSKPTYLRRLQIGKVDLVDKGAAVNARVTLFKRHIAKDGAPQQQPTLGQILAAMPEDKRAIVEAAIAEAAKAVQQPAAQPPAPAAQSENKPNSMQPPAEKAAAPQQQFPPKKEPEMPDQKPGEMSPEMRDEMKKQLTEEIRKQLADEAKTERETLAKKLVDAETAIAKMRDEQLDRECIAKAAELEGGAFGMSKAEVSALLKCFRLGKPVEKALADKVEAMIATAKNLSKDSPLFKEIGAAGSAPDSATAQLGAIAKRLQEKQPELSEAAALAKAYELNPSLYAKAMQEVSARS